MYSNILKVNL